jgi:glycosyltransferase involved in cell wall biosynthesis
MLFHLPLEGYKERYTDQLRLWYHNNWRKAGILFQEIEGTIQQEGSVGIGQVVNPYARTGNSFRQISQLLDWKLTDKDVILIDDAWTPGIEALPYTFHQLGIKPKIYCYWWAQSVDEYDFTAKMDVWMWTYENMVLDLCEGVFVANSLLKNLMIEEYEVDEDKIHVVGLPFDSTEVMDRMPAGYVNETKGFPVLGYAGAVSRKNQVVFSSRWDVEKQPEFFLQVAREVKKFRPDVNFVVTTSARKIRSNGKHLLTLLNQALADGVVELRENQTKEQYYATLCESKIQFNCALQDWVSFTLLEASVAGCYPIYPKFRSFPETLNYEKDGVFMYNPWSVGDAVSSVLVALDIVSFGPASIKKRSWIHKRYDDTWKRMTNVMGLTNYVLEPLYPES